MENQTIQQVPIDAIVWPPQVRDSSGFGDEDIRGLSQSMAESGGIHQALLAYRDGESLIGYDGERRWRAAKAAGLITVPVVIEESRLSAADVLYRQLVMDAQRVGLSPMERAKALQRLMAETGWPAAQVAVKLGVSPANISKLLALLILPDDIQKHVIAGRIAMSTAYELAKLSDSAERERLTSEVVSGNLSRDAVAAKARSLAPARVPSRQRKRATPRERVVIPLGEGRTVSVSAPSLSVDNLLAWLTDLVQRISSAQSEGRTLGDVVGVASSKRK
jgi:ParB family chromosome partitioning protein